MACPKTILNVTESAAEVNATFEGVLGEEAAHMLRGLAEHVRGKRKKKIVLDISGATDVEAIGLAGVYELEEASDNDKSAFELRARGPRAAELLAKAGLARKLKLGG
jgi:anti-anti-sigma regulatory factor